MAGHSYLFKNGEFKQIKHINRGSTKIKKGYVFKNGEYKQVWSGASPVTCYVQGVARTPVEVDEGTDVITALKAYEPTVGNATFAGWALTSGTFATLESLTATGEPMTLYAVFDYSVISSGRVVNDSFIQSTTSRPTAGYADSPTHYGGDWHGAVVSWEDGQWGSFSCNFVLATKAVGMRCSCDLYGYISGRSYDKESDIGASASISGIGTYYGVWHERRRYYPIFTVGSNNRTFSFAGKYAGSSSNWMPLTEAGCVSLTLRGN